MLELERRYRQWVHGTPNPSRDRLRSWLAERAATTPAGARVLDAGAGEAPYRDLFAHTTYESADFEQVEGKRYAESTYVCDLSSIPVDGDRFDAIICSQVLEHVPNPETVLREFHRVVKPGGEVWLSAPLFYEEHEQPFDFYRYTQFAWKRYCDLIGFELLSIERLEGFDATVSYQLKTAAIQLPWRLLPIKLSFALLARWFARRELKRPVPGKGMCINYRCVLRKPEHSDFR
jgi:SAM-dependent methyltransferase